MIDIYIWLGIGTPSPDITNTHTTVLSLLGQKTKTVGVRAGRFLARPFGIRTTVGHTHEPACSFVAATLDQCYDTCTILVVRSWHVCIYWFGFDALQRRRKYHIESNVPLYGQYTHPGPNSGYNKTRNTLVTFKYCCSLLYIVFTTPKYTQFHGSLHTEKVKSQDIACMDIWRSHGTRSSRSTKKVYGVLEFSEQHILSVLTWDIVIAHRDHMPIGWYHI